MRKEIKPAVRCKCCKQITEYPVMQQFCDQCGKLLPENMYPLDVSVSLGFDSSNRVDLCSWKCVRDYLIAQKKEIDKAWYVSLPMPIFRDNANDKQHCDSGTNFFKDFLQINESQPMEKKP